MNRPNDDELDAKMEEHEGSSEGLLKSLCFALDRVFELDRMKALDEQMAAMADKDPDVADTQ